MFSKHWQRIIQYPGAARDLDKAVMGKKVAESGGVHFFNKYEEIQHIDTHGPPELLKTWQKNTLGRNCQRHQVITYLQHSMEMTKNLTFPLQR